MRDVTVECHLPELLELDLLPDEALLDEDCEEEDDDEDDDEEELDDDDDEDLLRLL